MINTSQVNERVTMLILPSEDKKLIKTPNSKLIKTPNSMLLLLRVIEIHDNN
jgi:hypothetical protein